MGGTSFLRVDFSGEGEYTIDSELLGKKEYWDETEMVGCAGGGCDDARAGRWGFGIKNIWYLWC